MSVEGLPKTLFLASYRLPLLGIAIPILPTMILTGKLSNIAITQISGFTPAAISPAPTGTTTNGDNIYEIIPAISISLFLPLSRDFQKPYS